VSSICFQTVFIFARFLAFYFQLDIKFHQNFHFLFTWYFTENKGKTNFMGFKKIIFKYLFYFKNFKDGMYRSPVPPPSEPKNFLK